MLNYSVLHKIKQLRQIKPREKWVLSTYQKILGKEQNFIAQKKPITLWKGKPALVFSSLVLTGAVVLGVFTYLNLEGANSILSRISPSKANQEDKAVVASLAKMQVSLKKISSSLDELKKAKSPSQALAMTNVLKATAQEGEKVAKKIKDSHQHLSQKSLASLAMIEKTSQEVYSKSESMSKEFLESGIKDLQQRTLSKENQARLEQAISAYQNGDYERAKILVMSIYNNYNYK